MAKFKFVNTDSLPICPHCEKELEKVEQTKKGLLEGLSVIMCPYCKKVLGAMCE